MSDNNVGGVLAAVVVGFVVIGAAQGQQGGGGDPAAATTEPSGGDVIVGVHSSGSRGDLTHYAECGPNPGGEPAYEVQIPASMAYDTDIDGQPCPEGEHQELASDRYPELYDEMLRKEPYPFAGGDPAKTCGTWETDSIDAARQLAAECGPVTRGQL